MLKIFPEAPNSDRKWTVSNKVKYILWLMEGLEQCEFITEQEIGARAVAQQLRALEALTEDLVQC